MVAVAPGIGGGLPGGGVGQGLREGPVGIDRVRDHDTDPAVNGVLKDRG